MNFLNLVDVYITEALDNPYPYEYSDLDGGFVFYPDPTNKNIFYTVQTLRYNKSADSPSENGYTLEILFDYNDESTKQYGVTTMINANRGDQFRIMATVKDVVIKYLADKRNLNKIEIITFTSKNFEKGKTRLYSTLGQMLARTLGADWEFSTAPGTGEDAGAVRFNIKKKVVTAPKPTTARRQAENPIRYAVK